jgi:tight adherence protein C
MQLEYSLPIGLALLGFISADHDGLLLKSAVSKSFLIPGKESICSRLHQLGRSEEVDYENFRIAQLSYATLSFMIITSAYIFSVIQFLAYLLLLIVSVFIVLLATDRNLTQKCLKKKVEIENEFPAIVEMLTLSVGAGESPAASIKRIASTANGHLAREFQGLVGDIERGLPFTSALDAMSTRVQSENLRRFVDSLIISTSRGTPLVETLAHSANEARNRERVSMMAAAGKSEITMMIPVVFLILPISILFALFPSLTNLNLFSS